mmetsp:Transcript_32259/g.101609  ORF Transcript_32259/g.101609 Transcript_32259/m.101609 type:complete len:228 (+) Transcript_32259:181-864(+)
MRQSSLRRRRAAGPSWRCGFPSPCPSAPRASYLSASPPRRGARRGSSSYRAPTSSAARSRAPPARTRPRSPGGCCSAVVGGACTSTGRTPTWRSQLQSRARPGGGGWAGAGSCSSATSTPASGGSCRTRCGSTLSTTARSTRDMWRSSSTCARSPATRSAATAACSSGGRTRRCPCRRSSCSRSGTARRCPRARAALAGWPGSSPRAASPSPAGTTLVPSARSCLRP